jgi:hypothetical protein
MTNNRLAKNASLRVFLIAIVLMPGTASAWEHGPHGKQWQDPLAGYAVPIQAVYQFPAVLANQPTTPWGYAVPIQSSFQFPAVMANQPGAEVPFLGTDPTSGLLGGRPYLYHP